MGDIQRIVLQLRVLMAVPAIVDAIERDPHAPVLQMTGHAGLGMQRVARLLETGLKEPEHGMTLLRKIMTGQAFPVPGLQQPEIGDGGAQAKQMTDIGLQLLAQGTRCRQMAMLTGDVIVSAVHGPAGVQRLLTRQQQHEQYERPGGKAEDQAEILAETSGHRWRCREYHYFVLRSIGQPRQQGSDQGLSGAP